MIRPKKAELMPPFDESSPMSRRATCEEHWRLLYVAMTRASERLWSRALSRAAATAENSWHKRSNGRCPPRRSAGAGRRWGAVTRYRGDGQAPRLSPKRAEWAPEVRA